jgi:hypothetical protein
MVFLRFFSEYIHIHRNIRCSCVDASIISRNYLYAEWRRIARFCQLYTGFMVYLVRHYLSAETH